MMKSLVRQVLLNLGYSIHETAWIEQLKRGQCPHVPPGHFYSPHPDLEEVRAREESIFSREKAVLGIDLREEEQFQTLLKIADMYPSINFPESKTPEFRYYFGNPFYTYSDAIVLHAMLLLRQEQKSVTTA